MHSDEVNNIMSANVPAFLIKLWRLVNDHKYDSLISWSENGITFQVHDQVTFAQEVLPMYFKHNNFTSFVRQLNMYGFRKIVGSDKGSLKVESSAWEFMNPNFRRGHPELLDHVKRKINPNEDKKLKPEAYEKMLTELQQVQGKQDIMSQSFEDLKGQNQNIWSEILDLRQKHRKQQIVINKLIHFIYNLINQSSLGIGNKRLLMPERDSHSPKRPCLSQQLVPASVNSSQPSILEMPDSPVTTLIPPSTTGFDLPVEDGIVPPQTETSPSPTKKTPPLKLVMPSSTAVSLSTPSISTPDSNPYSALVALDKVPVSVMDNSWSPEPVAPGVTMTTVEASSSNPLGEKLQLDRLYSEIPKSPRLVAGDYCEQIDSNLDGLQKLLGTVEFNIDPNTLVNLFDDTDYVIYPQQELLEALTESNENATEPTSGDQITLTDVQKLTNHVDDSSQVKFGQNAIEWPFDEAGVPFGNDADQTNTNDLPFDIFQS